MKITTNKTELSVRYSMAVLHFNHQCSLSFDVFLVLMITRGGLNADLIDLGI